MMEWIKHALVVMFTYNKESWLGKFRAVVKRTCIYRVLEQSLGLPGNSWEILRPFFSYKTGRIIHVCLIGLFWKLNKILLKQLASCLTYGELFDIACSCLRHKEPLLSQILWDAEMGLYMQRIYWGEHPRRIKGEKQEQ